MIRVFLFSTLILTFPSIWKRGTGEFRIGKLALHFPYNPAWESRMRADEKIFAGTFTFLAQGAQSFVFESEDGEWVLKLFRHDRWIHPWRKFIRNRWLKKQERLPADQKIDRLFSSAKLAFEQAADLTGLTFIHLHQTDRDLPTVVLKDRMGWVHRLDLSTASFAIQKRARPLPEVFLEAILEGDEEKFKVLTRSFVDLLKSRTERGIRNTDTKVHLNFGFWKQKAIEWDFGNYCLDPAMNTDEAKQQEINRFLLKPERYMMGFSDWIEEFRKEALR